MNNRLLFAAVPNAVIDAFSAGDLTQSMFLILVFLYRKADWGTGRVQRVSASMIVAWMNGEYSERTIQENLQRLHYAGWIISRHRKNTRGNYRVDLGNFTALNGALKNKVLNITEIRDWRSWEANGRVERRGDDDVFGAEVTASQTASQARPFKAHNSPQESAIASNPIASTSTAYVCTSAEKTPAEQETLDYWYEHRINRTPDDLPLIKELVSRMNGNSIPLLQFVFTDPGEGDWPGWDKKSPNLPALLKHVRKGDILTQFAAYQEEFPEDEQSPSSALPLSKWQGICRGPGCSKPWVTEVEEVKLCTNCAAAVGV